MRRVVALFGVLLLAAGCTVTLGDKGELFLEFGTRISMGHDTSTTSSTATSNVEVNKALIDWFVDSDSGQTLESEGVTDADTGAGSDPE